jgi:hypothetical protein
MFNFRKIKKQQFLSSDSKLDMIVGGIPRSSTTLVAKIMSLQEQSFCYAGETHLIPQLHYLFCDHPCLPEKVSTVMKHLRRHFMQTMVEMPEYNVSKGAHKKNLLFCKNDVNLLSEWVEDELRCGRFGEDLYNTCLSMLNTLIKKHSDRPMLGEKTPDNIFAMAEYPSSSKNIIVVRSPFGVIKSMRSRVEDNDPYSSSFQGGLAANIGLYIEYARAAFTASQHSESLLVKYEELAERPGGVLKRLYKAFGINASDDIIEFIETAKNQEIADRAPMFYRRLSLKTHIDSFSLIELWNILNLTKFECSQIGYDEAFMSNLGLDTNMDWPLNDYPCMILPLFGIYEADEQGFRWAKKCSSILLHIPNSKAKIFHLQITYNYPEELANRKSQKIRLEAKGHTLKEIDLPAGAHSLSIDIALSEEHLNIVNNYGHYVIINIETVCGFVPLAHIKHSKDLRQLAFRIDMWELG